MRLINADAINYDDYWWNKGYSARDCQQAAKLISEQPTVDAVPVVHGKWLWELADNGWADHICSVCGYTENTDIHVGLGWRYCPNCGARMDGES